MRQQLFNINKDKQAHNSTFSRTVIILIIAETTEIIDAIYYFLGHFFEHNY